MFAFTIIYGFSMFVLFVCLEIAKGNEEKFTKMKDIYTKLREEHIQLLRTVCD